MKFTKVHKNSEVRKKKKKISYLFSSITSLVMNDLEKERGALVIFSFNFSSSYDNYSLVVEGFESESEGVYSMKINSKLATFSF